MEKYITLDTLSGLTQGTKMSLQYLYYKTWYTHDSIIKPLHPTRAVSPELAPLLASKAIKSHQAQIEDFLFKLKSDMIGLRCHIKWTRTRTPMSLLTFGRLQT